MNRTTSRERFLNSIRGKPVDRFFRYEHGPWPTTRQRWLSEGFPPERGFGEYFQMDPLTRLRLNSGYCDSPYHPKFVERTIEETATHRVFVDGDGITKREIKPRADLSMPQFLRFPVENRADWERARTRLRPEDARARLGDESVLRQACADPATPTLLPTCGIFGHARNLFGDERLAYILFDDPALLREILDDWRALYVALIREVTRVGRVDAVLIWEDLCYRNGPLISPGHFREFMLSPYRQFIGACRECGVEGIIVDTDGDCRSMIPLFLEAGANCIMPFEVQAGMDVAALRKQLGPTFCIMGGIDKRALAVDKAAIRAEVERVLPFFLESGRYIPTLDHTVPIDVSLDHFRYYLDCVREYETCYTRGNK